MVERILIERAVPLLDLDIERSGDGRTVTALAATFSNWYPVNDQDGDYDESLDPAAFNRALSRGALERVQVLFNHGRTIQGAPSDRYSMPLGRALEITADKRGLLTRTRYAKTDLADEVLELIREGAIKGQSFRGAIYRSTPSMGPGGRHRILRTELGLADYGPAPYVVNQGAKILAVRSAVDVADEIESMSADDRAELLRLLAVASPVGPSGVPTIDPAEEAPPVDGPAAELAADDTALLIAAQAQRRRRL